MAAALRVSCPRINIAKLEPNGRGTFGEMVLLVGQAHAQPPEYWYLSTRTCPQVLGAEPGPSLQLSRFDSQGHMWRCDAADLHVAVEGRPVIFLIQGSYYTAPMAVIEGSRIRNNLAAHGALTPDAIVVIFNWPSDLTHLNVVRDANDQARLAFVAGFHLARLLQGFPAGSRISLVGHSLGGLVALSALQLLAGGTLDTGEEATALREASPSLRLRAVVISAATDRDWLDPGGRLDQFGLRLTSPLFPFGNLQRIPRRAGRSGHDAP
jgi:pimeloyl-ACP methyl ester carboxylesterase